MKRIIVFLFFLVLFSGVGFGEGNVTITVESEEIGRPSLMRKEFGYTDCVFTSDGREFYTYKDSVLYHWQLMPHIKYLGSVPIGLKLKKERGGYNQKSFLFLTPSENKMLIWTPEHMELWDLQKKEKIADQKFKSIASVMTKEGFITVDKNYLITKWDTDNLQILQQHKLVNNCRVDKNLGQGFYYNCTPKVLLTKDNKLYTISHFLQREIDLETLKEIKYLEEEFGMNGYMTPDKKFIVDNKIIDLDNFKLLSKNMKPNSMYNDIRPTGRYVRYYQFGLLQIRGFQNKYISIYAICKHKQKLDKFDVKLIGFFLHNDYNWYFDRGNDNYSFSTSFPLNKLKMVLTGYKSIPMNKATYDKYYKIINFEELKDGKR